MSRLLLHFEAGDSFTIAAETDTDIVNTLAISSSRSTVLVTALVMARTTIAGGRSTSKSFIVTFFLLLLT